MIQSPACRGFENRSGLDNVASLPYLPFLSFAFQIVVGHHPIGLLRQALAALFEHFLTAGYEVHWRSLNTDVIVGRLSVEEVRF